MPRMRNGIPLFVMGQETEYRRTVHGGIALGDVDTHLETCGEDRGMSDTPFTEAFQITDTADAPELIADQIAYGQSFGIATDYLQLDIASVLQTFLQLSPLVQ
jgi:hypothetical protein